MHSLEAPATLSLQTHLTVYRLLNRHPAHFPSTTAQTPFTVTVRHLALHIALKGQKILALVDNRLASNGK
jgi:hypothetical protein